MHIGIPKSPGLSSAGAPSPHTPTPLNPNPPAGPYIELDDMKDDEHHGYQLPAENPRAEARLAEGQPASNDYLGDIINSWWIFEVLAWIISAAAMAVLVATLFLTDGRPLPHWPMRITLNSFISILGTVVKAAMVVPIAEGISQLKWLWFKKAGVLRDIQTFDEASRGMFGSLKLLLGTKGVHLAKLGAFLTVFSMAVDPFIQQIVTYPTRLVASEINSTVPVAHSYNDYSFGSIMALKNPTLSMKSAIQSALYDTNEDPLADFEITPSCPTGNCTWDEPYHSLAICSKCANITESLDKKCEIVGTRNTCTWTLPNGFMLDGSMQGQIYMNSTGMVDSINFNQTQPTLTTLTTIRSLHDLSSMALFGATAMECVLYTCVNTYTARVSNGHFTETIIANHTNTTLPTTNDNITITPPNSADQYWMGPYAWNALSTHFWSLWDGNVTGSTGESSASNDLAGALYELGDNGTGNGTPRPGGDSITMAALAKSMTLLLRKQAASNTAAAGADNNSTAHHLAAGTAWVTETYVHVRWWWIALPAALEALTLVFLLGTILRSAASGMAIWKSSTLALLNIRMVQEEEEVRNANAAAAAAGGFRRSVAGWGSGKLGELNQWASRSEVQLQRSEAGASEFHMRRKEMS